MWYTRNNHFESDYSSSLYDRKAKTWTSNFRNISRVIKQKFGQNIKKSKYRLKRNRLPIKFCRITAVPTNAGFLKGSRILKEIQHQSQIEVCVM